MHETERTVRSEARSSTAPRGPEEQPPSRGALVDDALPVNSKVGPWRIERELGRGGMGAIYAAVHEEIGKRAALKIMHARLFARGDAARALLEARVVNQVRHAGIIDIFGVGTLVDGRPYIVMERLEGVSLRDRAHKTTLSPETVIAILLQVCDALIAAHAVGVIHRDLKLDNVFLLEHPGEEVPRVKLLDWGIAKVINRGRYTSEGPFVGTPRYVAPEQARGRETTERTDVYSLGVIAYELFLRTPPFVGDTIADVLLMHLHSEPKPPRDLWEEIPSSLEALLLAMLEKEPHRRPTMNEVSQWLEQVRSDLHRPRVAMSHAPIIRPTDVPAIPWVVDTVPRRRLRGAWPFALGLLALAAVVLMVIFALESDTDLMRNVIPGPAVPSP